MLLLGRLTAAHSSSCLCKTKSKIKNSGTTKPLKETSALSVLLLLVLLFPILLKWQIIKSLQLVLFLPTIVTVNMLACYPRGSFRLKRSPTSGRCPRWLVFLKKLFYQDNCKEAATIRGGQIRGALFSFFVVKKCLFNIFRRLPQFLKWLQYPIIDYIVLGASNYYVYILGASTQTFPMHCRFWSLRESRRENVCETNFDDFR